MTSDARAKDLDGRIRGELVDSFDEELEMEIDDDRLKLAIEEFAQRSETASIDRALYFRELFRLQGELVKLQDWVMEQKQKVVVIFEGRDAAGKGGVIKRITLHAHCRGAMVDCRSRGHEEGPVELHASFAAAISLYGDQAATGRFAASRPQS